MRVLLDTNILLDVLLRREPWVTQSKEIWRAHDQGRLAGHIMASALTDIFYVARKLVGYEHAREAVGVCLRTFDICVVDRTSLEQAHSLPGSDFEDNLQIACAQLARLGAIVSRDKTGFRLSQLQVLTPAELLEQLPA